jgi:hypothetical protein
MIFCWGPDPTAKPTSQPNVGEVSRARTGPDVPERAVTILGGKDIFLRWIALSRPAVLVAEPGSTERKTLAGPVVVRVKSEGSL